jgi:hypothetical protein
VIHLLRDTQKDEVIYAIKDTQTDKVIHEIIKPMTADTAVNLMLEHEILPNKLIPAEACPYIAKALEMMWQVAEEATIKRLAAHNKKPVRMLDSNRNLIATFPSAVEAAKKTGRGVTGVYSAIDRKSLTRDGYYFERVEQRGN